MRTVWANAAGCAYWRADSQAELLSRDFGDASESARARLTLTVLQAHARGEVLRESWTLYPKGAPVTSIMVSRGLLLPDAMQALLFVSELLPAQVAPDTLRGVEAIAHTAVRSTLHSLRGGSVLMRNPATAQPRRPSVRCLHFRARFNARDIGDLKAVQRALELARTTANNAKVGHMMLSLNTFSLSQCITEALSPLLLAANDKNLKLTWQVADGVPDQLVGDALRLRQVLINLVGNALKFTHSAEVRVEVAPALAESTTIPTADPVETPEPTLRFSVHDTGIGLGLMIVAHLVKLMGAEMQVTSTPGKASCFAFVVPLIPA